MAAAVAQVTLTSAAVAEPWAKVGPWTVISLSNATGCTMGLKYSSGAVLVVSAKYSVAGDQAWEMLAADQVWQAIEKDKSYPISIHFVGSDQAAQRRELYSYKASRINGLVARFSDFSEFYSFVSNGLATGTHVAFAFDGRLMGTFALPGAAPAFDEFLKCYAEFVSRAES